MLWAHSIYDTGFVARYIYSKGRRRLCNIQMEMSHFYSLMYICSVMSQQEFKYDSNIRDRLEGSKVPDYI